MVITVTVGSLFLFGCASSYKTGYFDGYNVAKEETGVKERIYMAQLDNTRRSLIQCHDYLKQEIDCYCGDEGDK